MTAMFDTTTGPAELLVIGIISGVITAPEASLYMRTLIGTVTLSNAASDVRTALIVASPGDVISVANADVALLANKSAIASIDDNSFFIMIFLPP
jgi:hypothetical protein